MTRAAERPSSSPPRDQRLDRIARWTANLLHPAVIGFAVALTTTVRFEGGFTVRVVVIGALVTGATVLFPLLALLVAYALGWTRGDLFCRRRENRRYVYAPALVGLAVAAFVFARVYPFALGLTMTAGAVLVAVSLAAANRALKVSIHTAGNAAITVAAFFVYGVPAAALLGAVLAVAWARVRTHNHTVAEVIAGGLIGSGVTAAWLYAIGWSWVERA